MSEQEWVDRDFYADLGVSKQATADDVKRAYRKLARENHPDANPGDSRAEDTFKRVSEAYSVLSDPEKRRQYDQVRQMAGSGARPRGNGFAGQRPGGAGFDLGDLFGFSSSGMGRGDAESLFERLFNNQAGGRRAARGQDVEAELELAFRTAARGGQLPLELSDEAGARTLHVRVPAGVSDGQRIRLSGRGQPGPGGGPAGDLYIRVRVLPDPVFERSGDDLVVTLPVTFPEAALGATVTAPTLDGSVSLRVPPGSPSGRSLRVRGRGLPGRRGTGDLLVTLQITVPDEFGPAAQEAVRSFAEATSDHDPRGELTSRHEAENQRR